MAKLNQFPACKNLDVAQPDWDCGPVGVTRDSDALTRANFDALCDELDAMDPHGREWEIIRWGHWAVGWIEEIFTKPGSKPGLHCEATRERLKDYPCLSEDLWVKYDMEDQANA